jgi:glyceraldehyde 3-phosphate dehydrogenase
MHVSSSSCSITDCVFEVARKTTAEEVNAFLKEAADGGELNPKPQTLNPKP